MNLTFIEAKRQASQYQKEAEKCNAATEACEGVRERAEASLIREEKKVTALAMGPPVGVARRELDGPPFCPYLHLFSSAQANGNSIRTIFPLKEMGNDRSAYTVDEALTAMGFGKFQVLGLIYAGMGWLTEAMEMMLLSFIGPTVQSEWGLSSYEESLISSAVFAGMIVGAYLWGIFSDNYGRKKGFFVTALVTGGAGFLSSFAPNYSILIILRCLVGIGLGGCPVLLSWLLEFVPSPCRGTSVAVLSAFWTLGTVFEALLAWIVIPRLSWRWFLALSSLPALMLLLFYSFMPESPRYLCMKGRKTDALHVLEKISRVNKMKLPPGMLVLDKKVEQYENSIQEETACLLPEERHEPTSSGGSNFRTGVSATPFMLFSPQLIKSTLLLWVVYFGNGFSYYGIVLLTSEISNSSRKCVSNGLEHSKGTSSLYRDVLITSFAEFPGLLISAAAVDRIGRKLSFSALYFEPSQLQTFILPRYTQPWSGQLV
ncbi:hypothetical protein AAC387_Pa04g1348 [Persea americana]